MNDSYANYKIDSQIDGKVIKVITSVEYPSPRFGTGHRTVERLRTMVINTEDTAIREGLIKLGWTPPP